MGALQRFEQRLESMVTGAFARAFRSAVQPMEIAAALQREFDNSAQILSRDRRLVPNDFNIELSPTDYDRLATTTTSSQSSPSCCTSTPRSSTTCSPARSDQFERADDLTTGRFRVRSQPRPRSPAQHVTRQRTAARGCSRSTAPGTR